MSEVIQTQTNKDVSLAGLTPVDAPTPGAGNTVQQNENSPSSVPAEGFSQYEKDRLEALNAPIPEGTQLDMSRLVPMDHVAEAPTTTQTTPAKEDEEEQIPIISPSGELPKKLNFRPQSHFDLEVVTLKRQNYSWEMATEMAARKFPDAPESQEYWAKRNSSNAATTENNQQSSDESTFNTVAELQAELESIEDKILEATSSFDLDEAKRLKSLERQLKSQLPLVKAKEVSLEQAQVADAQARFNADFQSNLDKATKLFPQLADPNSPLCKKAVELQAQARANNDPMYMDPASALHFATEAALQLGATAGSATPPPQAKVSMPSSPGLIASPSARPQSSPQQNIDPNSWSADDYEKMLNQHTRAPIR